MPADRERLSIPTSVGHSLSLNSNPRFKIWIDLENTPHVPFFLPIIRELETRGYRISLTARDAFQVCELADQKGLDYVKIGRHYGKNLIRKALGLLWRSAQLIPFYLRERPRLALSHGARAQILLCNVVRVPAVLITDYEHAKVPPLVRARWAIVPDSVPGDEFRSKSGRVRKYHGIKEDVYAPDFKPDASLADELGLQNGDIIVTVRPPADEAHYHNPEAELLLTELMDRICGTPRIRAVLLPRNRHQEQVLRTSHPSWFNSGKICVPSRAVDGLNLLWFSDLVVSGGGTMNREAAALGVPVYSIFRGKMGAVDRKLEQEGRLVIIQRTEEVRTKIVFERRDKSKPPDNQRRPALQEIVDHIEDIIQTEYPRLHRRMESGKNT